MTKKIDYKAMSLEELTSALVDVETELKQAKIARVTNELANPQRIQFLRRQIAKIKTEINQKLIAESEEA